MNPELWCDYILDKVDGIESLIKSVQTIDGVQERLDKLYDAKDQLDEIERKDLRQLNLEARLENDANKRHTLQKDLRVVQIKFHATKGLLSSVKARERRRELFIGDEGDKALAHTSFMQDETQSALSNMKRMIAESKYTGTSSLQELRRHRKVIESIGIEADIGGEKISRSQKLVKKFRRGIMFR